MRRHKSNPFILIITGVLMFIGLLIIYTIGPVRAILLNGTYGSDYSESYFFTRQVLFVFVSLLTFFFFYKCEYKKLRKLAKVAMVFAILACVLLAFGQVLSLPFVKCELGACRWFKLGPLSLQPAEILKLALALFLPQIAAEYKRSGGLSGKKINWVMFKKGLTFQNFFGDVFILIKRVCKSPIGAFWIKYALSVGLSIFFVAVCQKDLGSTIPILIEAIAVLLIAGVSIKMMLLVGGCIAIVGVLLIVTSPHRMERVATYIGMSSISEESTGDSSDSDDAYHIENALIAIGSGGMFGVGIGNSVQATGYLPESINDSVFAILGETFGFVGLVMILLAFFVLLWNIIKVADYSVDYEMSLVAVAAFAWLLTHVVVNIMAMTGLVPLTGITLPLLSYGGTSIICVGAILGLVMQISCYTGRSKTTEKELIYTGDKIGVRDSFAAAKDYGKKTITKQVNTGVSYASRYSHRRKEE